MSTFDTNETASPEAGTVTVALEPALLDGLDAYCAGQRDTPSRSEAVRHILRDWLRGHGHLHSAEEGTRPEDLSSANDD